MATTRITEKQLEAIVARLNEALDRPAESYTKGEDGRFRANIGNFHLYHAYGMVGVHEMFNEGGGVHATIQLGTKRETADKLWAMLDGINLGLKWEPKV